MNLKDYKQVSIIYSTTDDSIFYTHNFCNFPGGRPLNDVRVKEIQKMILKGSGIWPFSVIPRDKSSKWRFTVKDGQHRLQAIKNINEDKNMKIEIPFYMEWLERTEFQMKFSAY